MVLVIGIRFTAGILAMAAVMCAVALGLPMWVDVSYKVSSTDVFMQLGLWQDCIRIGTADTQCSENTSSLSTESTAARYLATATTGLLIFAAISLIIYAAQCTRSTYILIIGLILIILAMGGGGAATFLFLNDNLFSSSEIGVGSILEICGIGLALVSFIFLIISLVLKGPADEIYPAQARHTRRGLPDPELLDGNDVNSTATNNADHYISRYNHYMAQYHQTMGNPTEVARYLKY